MLERVQLRILALTLVIIAVAPRSTIAQLSVVEALTKNVTDIGVYTHFGWPKQHSEVGATRGYWSGFGIELSYTVFTTRRYKDPAVRRAMKDLDAQLKRYAELVDAQVLDSIRKATTKLKSELDTQPDPSKIQLPPSPRRTKKTPVEEVAGIGTQVETKSSLAVVDAVPPTEDVWVVEFGLAYTQMQSFSERIAPAVGADSGEVRGGIREFPSVSVYASCRICFYRIPIIGTQWRVRPYFGLRGGLMQLSNLRAYSPYPSIAAQPPLPGGMLVLKGEGSTFQGAGLGGLAFNIGPAHFFFEGAHTWRTVPSIDWSGTPSNVVFPNSLPRALDLSAWSFAVGTQIHVAK
jgi:hypothetical protein